MAGKSYRRVNYSIGTDGWQQHGLTPDQKWAAKCASKEAYQKTLASFGKGGGQGGQGGKGGDGKGKGKGKGKGDGKGKGNGKKKGNVDSSGWIDYSNNTRPAKTWGSYVVCAKEGCDHFEYLSNMLANSIACRLCNTIYNPYGMSEKQLVHWRVAAAAVKKSGVEVPYEAPEKIEIEAEPMQEDGGTGTIDVDGPRVVNLDKKI